MMNTLYGNNIYAGVTGIPAMNPGFTGFASSQQQASFDAAYAATVNASTNNGETLDFVKTESPTKGLEPIDIKSLLAKINPKATKKIVEEVGDVFSCMGGTTEKKKSESKDSETEEKKEDKSKAQIKIDDRDKAIIPIHTVTGYILNVELERCATSLFSQIFDEYIGTRVSAVDVPSAQGNKIFTVMELQFAMKPGEAADGKLKSVCKIEDELDVKKASGEVDAKTAELINFFNTQKTLCNQKADLKLNKQTREILTPFINKSVFIGDGKGNFIPDWKNLERCSSNINQSTGMNNRSNGEFIVTVKIDPCIFISKLMTILEEATADKYLYNVNYYAPASPEVVAKIGDDFYNVWRANDKLPFFIEVRETNIKEAIRIQRLTSTGRFGTPNMMFTR